MTRRPTTHTPSDIEQAAYRPETAPPPEPEGETTPTVTRLTTRHSAAFGAAGRFVDLTEIEALAAPEGLLAVPTAEQLAQRL